MYQSKLGNQEIDHLFEAILTLETLEDCYRFFEDLCTPKEIEEMSKRMKAAKMLSDGKIYTEVAEKTGLSTATISRVSRCIKDGDEGYTAVLERMKNEAEAK